MLAELWIGYLSWALIVAVLLMLALILFGPRKG